MLQDICPLAPLTDREDLLSARPELAIFAALIVGYAIGAIKGRPVPARRRGGDAARRAGDRPGRRHDRSQPAALHVHAVHLRPGLLGRAAVLRQRRPHDLDLGSAGRRRGRSDRRRRVRRRLAVQAGCRNGERPAGGIGDRVGHGRHRERGDRQTRARGRRDEGAAGQRRNGVRAVLHLQPDHHRVVRQPGRAEVARHRLARGERAASWRSSGAPI